jgi:hypothetical protein
MGLESKLVPYDQDAGEHLWYVQGRRFTTPTGDWPLDGLTPQEKRDPFVMLPTYLGPALAAVGDPTAPDFPTPAALDLDPYRIDEYLRHAAASDTWIQILFASEGKAARMNALAVAMVEATLLGPASGQTFGLMGGNGQLPWTLAGSAPTPLPVGCGTPASCSPIARWACCTRTCSMTRRRRSPGLHPDQRATKWRRAVSQYLPGLREREVVAAFAKVWQDDP